MFEFCHLRSYLLPRPLDSMSSWCTFMIASVHVLYVLHGYKLVYMCVLCVTNSHCQWDEVQDDMMNYQIPHQLGSLGIVGHCGQC